MLVVVSSDAAWAYPPLRMVFERLCLLLELLFCVLGHLPFLPRDLLSVSSLAPVQEDPQEPGRLQGEKQEKLAPREYGMPTAVWQSEL